MPDPAPGWSGAGSCSGPVPVPVPGPGVGILGKPGWSWCRQPGWPPDFIKSDFSVQGPPKTRLGTPGIKMFLLFFFFMMCSYTETVFHCSDDKSSFPIGMFTLQRNCHRVEFRWSQLSLQLRYPWGLDAIPISRFYSCLRSSLKRFYIDTIQKRVEGAARARVAASTAGWRHARVRASRPRNCSIHRVDIEVSV